MKKKIIPIALAMVLFACEKDERVSPGGGGGGAATPTAYRINTISVAGFNVNNSDGEGWDEDNPLTFGTADIYVKGYEGSTHVYTSEIEHNVINYQTYPMNDADFGSLPMINGFEDGCTIKLYDDDGAFGEDLIGRVDFDGEDLYQNDEATSFSMQLTGTSNLTIVMTGEFSYQ